MGTFTQEAIFDLAGIDHIATSFEAACRLEKPFARAAVVVAPEIAVATPGPVPVAADPKAPSGPTAVGPWQVEEKVSLVDDSRTVLVSQESKTEVSHLRPTKPVLVFRCQRKAVDAYIFSAQIELRRAFLSNRVGVGVDGGPLAEIDVSWSEDGHSVFFDPKKLLKRIGGHQRLGFADSPKHKIQVLKGQAEFDLTDLERALAPLRDACRFK